MNTENKNGKLTIIAHDIESRLAKTATDLENYKTKMMEDYTCFFRWYMEDAYKASAYMEAYKCIQVYIRASDISKLRQYLRHQVESIIAQLLNAGVRGFCISAEALAEALAEANDLEAKRHLLDQYKMMLNTLGKESQGEGRR